MLRRTATLLRPASRIDWAAMTVHVAPEQKPDFIKFKQSYDKIRQELDAVPAQPEALNFQRYRDALGANAGIVDDIENMLKSMDFNARPGVENEIEKIKADTTLSAEDKKRFMDMAANKVDYIKKLEERRQVALKQTASFVEDCKYEISELEKNFKSVQARKSIDELTVEELHHQFPKAVEDAGEFYKRGEYDACMTSQAHRINPQ